MEDNQWEELLKWVLAKKLPVSLTMKDILLSCFTMCGDLGPLFLFSLKIWQAFCNTAAAAAAAAVEYRTTSKFYVK